GHRIDAGRSHSHEAPGGTPPGASSFSGPAATGPAPQRDGAPQRGAAGLRPSSCDLREAAEPDGVLPVTVPVTHVDLVTRATEGHDDVRRATREGVLHVEGDPAADGEGVPAVPVPVAGVDLVVRATVDEHGVGVAAGQRVLHVVLRATADREGVLPVAVPVTDQDVVAGPPV